MTIHLKIGFNDPCGFLPTQKILWHYRHPRENKTSCGRGIHMLLKATEIKEGKKEVESLQLEHKKPVEILIEDNFSTTQNVDWN